MKYFSFFSCRAREVWVGINFQSVSRDLLTNLTMAICIFAYHASHQTSKAIQMCKAMMPLTEKLIAQMPCYVYPYANIFSVLPFLYLYREYELIEKVSCNDRQFDLFFSINFIFLFLDMLRIAFQNIK